jgi:hypothetical protein
MPISIPCPRCEQVWPVNEELLGQAVRCPGCQYRLPVPDPPGQEIRDVEIRYDIGTAFWAALGSVLLTALGIYLLARFGGGILDTLTYDSFADTRRLFRSDPDKKAVVLGAGFLASGVIGAFFSVRKLLNSEAPALVLKADGIVVGKAQTRLSWDRIVDARLVIKFGSDNKPTAETLNIKVADEAGAVSETRIDVHGLDRESHDVARLVMHEFFFIVLTPRCNSRK